MNRADIKAVREALRALPPGKRVQVLADELMPVWSESPDARRLTAPMRAELPRFGDIAAAELLFALACWLETEDQWEIML